MFNRAKLKFDDIFENRIEEKRISGYLTWLHEKGETAEEIASASSALRDHAKFLNIPYNLKEELVDCCGTGRDDSNSFNISTTSAILATACGSKIAKHGFRNNSSNSESADVLEQLGFNLNISAENQVKMLEKTNFCFLFSDNYNPCLERVKKIICKVPHRTILDIIKPLSNPAMVTKQLFGVYDKKLVPIVAQALVLLGAKRAMIVCSEDNLDEISICDITHAAFVDGGNINYLTIDPRKYGFDLYSKDKIAGGSPKDNALILKNVLEGSQKGAKRDIVLLNTAFTLLVDKKVHSAEEGVFLAKSTIDSGKAAQKLQEIIDVSNSF